MIDIPYDIWIEGEMIEEIEALRTEVTKLKNRIEVYELAEKAYIEVGEKLDKENESLKKQVQILTDANNNAYKMIEQISKGTA